MNLLAWVVDFIVVPPNICSFAVIGFGSRIALSKMRGNTTNEICTKKNGGMEVLQRADGSGDSTQCWKIYSITGSKPVW